MPDVLENERTWIARKAVKTDLPVLGQFSALTAIETEGRKLEPEKIIASLARVLDDPNLGQMFIAEDGGEPVGSFMLNGREWSEWRNGVFFWITGLYVVPEYRRRGVMFDLYRAGVEWVREQPDALGLRAYVHRDNDLDSVLGTGTAQIHNRDSYDLSPMHPTPYVVIEVLV